MIRLKIIISLFLMNVVEAIIDIMYDYYCRTVTLDDNAIFFILLFSMIENRKVLIVRTKIKIS